MFPGRRGEEDVVPVPSTGWVPVDGGAAREVGLRVSSEIGPSRGGWRGKIRGPSPDGAARERGSGETAAGAVVASLS